MSVRIEHINEVMRKYFLDFFTSVFLLWLLLLLLKPRYTRRCLLSVSAVSISFSVAVPVSFSFSFCYCFCCCCCGCCCCLASSLWGVPWLSAPTLLSIGERVFIFPFFISNFVFIFSIFQFFVFSIFFCLQVIVRIYSCLMLILSFIVIDISSLSLSRSPSLSFVQPLSLTPPPLQVTSRAGRTWGNTCPPSRPC